MAVWGDAMQKHGFRRSTPLRHRLPSDLSAIPGTMSPGRRQLQGGEAVDPGSPYATGSVLDATAASPRLAVP